MVHPWQGDAAGHHVGVADGLDLLQPVPGGERIPAWDTRSSSLTTSSGARPSANGVKPTMSANVTVTPGKASAITASDSLSRFATGSGSTFSSRRSDFDRSTSSAECFGSGSTSARSRSRTKYCSKRYEVDVTPRILSAKNRAPRSSARRGRARSGRGRSRQTRPRGRRTRRTRASPGAVPREERPERGDEGPDSRRRPQCEAAEAPLH